MSLDLGIDITRTPPQMAHWKGAVESFLGTVKEGFISMLPGRIVRVQKKDGGFEDIKETKLTFRQFQQYFLKWVVDIYAHSEHRELENTPMNVWQAGVQQFPPDLPDDPEAVKMACSYWDKRKLQADGINIFNERYQSPELKEIWRRSDATPHDLDIRIDPSDLGQIYVKDKEQHRFIPVPCNSAPMSGVDLWTYEARRGRLNAERKERQAQSDVPMQKRALIEAAGTGLTQTKGQLVRGHARAEMAAEIVRKKPRKVVPPTNSLAPGQTDQGEIERLSKLLRQAIGDQKI
jgi:putative transposase